MNQIILRILLADNTNVEVTTSAGDIVKWETHFDLGIDKLERASHLYYLAWLALTRLGKTGLGFDAWVDGVAGVEVDDPKA
jgi:hypothetical protein